MRHMVWPADRLFRVPGSRSAGSGAGTRPWRVHQRSGFFPSLGVCLLVLLVWAPGAYGATTVTRPVDGARGVAAVSAAAGPELAGTRGRADISPARGWQHVPLDAPGLTQGSAQLVAGGPGLVAFAPGEQGVPVGLWSSADGRTWHTVPLPAFQPDDQPTSFDAAGRLYVITGSAGVPGIWASQDAGVTWHQSPEHLYLTALVAGGDGIIAFSQGMPPDFSTRVWTSSDGLAWRELPEASRTFTSAAVFDVVHAGADLIAIGHINGSGAAIWTSRDGVTWTQIPNNNAIFDRSSFVDRIVAGPRGIVVAGAEPSHQVLWVSEDGVHWRHERNPASVHLGNLNVGALAAWQDGFVQFSDEAGETAVWSSTDGLTWTRLGSDELFGGSARVTNAIAFQGGIVALGGFADHPQPACLRTRQDAFDDLRTFHPAAFLWSPAAGASAPPPTSDPSDPRLLKLLPTDLPSTQNFTPSTAGGGYLGAYVNLCALDPALGRHRAYLVFFVDPYSDRGTGNLHPGEALSIVTQSSHAAASGFRFVDRLFGFGLATVQHRRQLPAGVRIGEGTQVFQFRLRFAPHDVVPELALAWRQGRVIGVVEAATRHEVILLAQRQLAHLEQQRPNG
ncbi:MAG TPA: hypothetical protein VFB58_15625 [Chloroflexota bacterium]|nr:hypothetical protein [Chloroflexota bacterium]